MSTSVVVAKFSGAVKIATTNTIVSQSIGSEISQKNMQFLANCSMAFYYCFLMPGSSNKIYWQQIEMRRIIPALILTPFAGLIQHYREQKLTIHIA